MDTIAEKHTNIADSGCTPKLDTAPLPSQSGMSSRATQRMERLAALESEMRAEEKEALEMLMTKEQTKTLMRTFDSVKTEFSDLDGMKWDKGLLLGASSARTLKPDTDENDPPSSSYNAFPSSISLPALHFATPSNAELTVRTFSGAPLRSYLPDGPGGHLGDVENDPHPCLQQAYGKGVKRRVPAHRLFVSGNLERSLPPSFPKNSTPFPLDLHATTPDVDIATINQSQISFAAERSDFSDLTVRSPRANRTESKTSAPFLFGLGVQWPSGSTNTIDTILL